MLDRTPRFLFPLPDAQTKLSSQVSALAFAVDRVLFDVTTGSSWKDPVVNAAALPLVGNTDGDVRVTLDTHTIFVWDSTGAVWIPVGSGISVYAGSFEQPAKPTIAQIPDGWWGYWWDTVKNRLWHVRNRGGIMYAVRLTPLP